MLSLELIVDRAFSDVFEDNLEDVFDELFEPDAKEVFSEALSANKNRLISPPEAVSAKGCKGSPRLGLNSKTIRSAPKPLGVVA